MTPRIVPENDNSLATVYPAPSPSGSDPAIEAGLRATQRAGFHRDADEGSKDPYRAQYRTSGTATDATVPIHSFFRDLIVVEESQIRSPIDRGREAGIEADAERGAQ